MLPRLAPTVLVLTRRDAILHGHSRPCSGRRRRTGPPLAGHGLVLPLGHTRLLPDRLLGLEPLGLGLQVRGHGLRRRWPRRDRFWNVRPRLFVDSRQTGRENDAELPPAQRLLHLAWHHPAVVWLAGLQRRISIRREFESDNCLLE